jgi:hypothetical protein
MGMSQTYGPADRAESVATLHRALDLGVTFVDTSDVYGDGHNEELVGAAIAGRRGEVQLATTFSLKRNDRGGLDIDGRPENVRAPVLFNTWLWSLTDEPSVARGVKVPGGPVCMPRRRDSARRLRLTDPAARSLLSYPHTRRIARRGDA